MHNLSVISVKCVGLVMALPIALICIFSPQLFTIWVGEEFAHLSSLIWILLIPLTMIVAFRPLIVSYTAYNKVRLPAIITIIAGILNLILAVTFNNCLWFGVIRNCTFIQYCSMASQCHFCALVCSKSSGSSPFFIL